MPYIVTTHRHLDDPTAEFLPGAEPGVSRRAVATLKEARTHAFNEAARLLGTVPHMGSRTVHPAMETHGPKAMLLGESGGTVGPLPDGTVIEVAPVSDDQLRAAAAHRVDNVYTRPLGEVIDAYNAARETHANA